MVFADTFMAHVSYVDNVLPQCLPIIALFHKVGDITFVYLHGHPSSRLMELVRQKRTENGKEKEKTVVLDGLALSSAPNGHTFKYHCAVIHGECTRETDLDLKRAIMKAATNHIVADRWEDVHPVASFQVLFACVLRVDIGRMSIKSRTGIPGIQPRDKGKDGPDREEPIWNGVMPLYDVLDRPVESVWTYEAIVPEGLENFIEKRNETHKQYGLKVAKL
ncbi:hypothetical protein BKA64DRAFT_731142 [Cadophora sp. MPI-SDFR-AT-0126]|nr:hypothetical protein BKA64DRAFT_731142 [Leotiomycetes sp. MPI-SDFR-AT-0126]